MIFPPIAFGPLEDINPSDISVSENVDLVLRPVPRVGSVDIKQDYAIARTSFFEFFLSGTERKTESIRIDELFSFSEAIKQAISKRFANQSADYQSFKMPTPSGKPIKVVLPTYRPRSAPPQTIRLMFQETVTGDRETTRIAFKPSLDPVPPAPELWAQVSKSDKAVLLSMLENRFEQPVDDFLLSIDHRQYVASFEKEAVQFPYPPVEGHPMGIDSAGRDVMARILYGLRISLSFGLMLVGATMMLGIFAGSIQGYYGGRLDITAQRMIEVWSAIPFLYVMILMGSIYGRSFMLLLICYGLFNWVGISYYVRAEFLNLRKRQFVEAAKCMGVPSHKIIFKHIMPNALVPVITFFPFSLVGAIGALAALDYLGFGLPPPTPSWGELLFQAQQYRWAWWLILYPSMALFIVMLLGVFVGEGIRNAYDPKQYTRLE